MNPNPRKAREKKSWEGDWGIMTTVHTDLNEKSLDNKVLHNTMAIENIKVRAAVRKSL